MVLLSECMSYKKTLREGLRDEYRIILGLNYFTEVKAKNLLLLRIATLTMSLSVYCVRSQNGIFLKIPSKNV